jgi:hypothetical protein
MSIFTHRLFAEVAVIPEHDFIGAVKRYAAEFEIGIHGREFICLEFPRVSGKAGNSHFQSP